MSVAEESNESVEPNFYTSAEWESGFTGKIEITNAGKNLDGWQVEFEAPFEITEIWNAEIISKGGNKYVLGNLGYNKNLSQGESETITFNAEKVGGEVVEPQNYVFSDRENTLPVNRNVTQQSEIARLKTSPSEELVEIAANNRDFHYMGRIEGQDSASPILSYAGSSVEFNFTGTELKIELAEDDWGGENYVDVYIDGNPQPTTTLHLNSGKQPQVYNIATGLENKAHRALVVKRNDYITGEFEFHGIVTDGRMVSANLGSSRKIEVYGDSISTGAAVEPENSNSTARDNAYKSFGWILAREYDAEVSLVAQGGVPLVDGYGSWNQGTGMEAFYDKTKPLSNASQWDFDRYNPDLVIVALGQNDQGVAELSGREWKNHYKEFMGNLREEHPDAYFVGMFTNMYHDPAWDNYLTEAIAEYKNETNDNRVYSLITEQVTAEHSDYNQQKAMTNDLANLIDNTLTADGFSWDTATLTPVSDAAESATQTTAMIATDTGVSVPAEGQFNYGEALQKSFLLFEANRSGKLPVDNRIEWRGNSALDDGADVGRDLTGGYYDAGDHVKFGLPAAASVAMLAWGGIEYKRAYQQSGQWDKLLDAVKWGTDYFLKSHVTESGKTKEFYAQVGDGNADHAFWGSPEEMTMARPAFKIDTNNPGSDVAAGTASALAAASVLFRGVDDGYADRLLKNAEQLFEFADTYRGKYSDSIPQANPFYTSSGYIDELAESAAWLCKATGQQKYLDRAEAIYDNEIDGVGNWTWSWDSKEHSTLLLLAQESDNPKYRQKFEDWANKWIDGTDGVQYTRGGLAWRTDWGSLALSSASAFLVGLYNDTVKSDSKYRDFSINQINYILGDNPRNSSYMVGFGKNYPQQPHHRAAAGDAPSGQPNENIIFGGIVGGPKSPNDFDYSDNRDDWVSNEVATGYNAPLTSALIQAYGDFGGEPLTNSELNNLVGIENA